METRRWLLPFTWSMDMQAVDAAVRLADGGEAALVAVSLIARSDKPGAGAVRLEHIQQSKDFLEAVRWKAERLRVPLERHEVITVDALSSIATFAHELHCDAIVLVSRGDREVLLHSHQLKHLLAEPPAALLVLRLAAQKRGQPAEKLGTKLLAWLRQITGDWPDAATEPETLATEEPLWIRTEGYHR